MDACKNTCIDPDNSDYLRKSESKTIDKTLTANFKEEDVFVCGVST